MNYEWTAQEYFRLCNHVFGELLCCYDSTVKVFDNNMILIWDENLCQWEYVSLSKKIKVFVDFVRKEYCCSQFKNIPAFRRKSLGKQRNFSLDDFIDKCFNASGFDHQSLGEKNITNISCLKNILNRRHVHKIPLYKGNILNLLTLNLEENKRDYYYTYAIPKPWNIEKTKTSFPDLERHLRKHFDSPEDYQRFKRNISLLLLPRQVIKTDLCFYGAGATCFVKNLRGTLYRISQDGFFNLYLENSINKIGTNIVVYLNNCKRACRDHTGMTYILANHSRPNISLTSKPIQFFHIKSYSMPKKKQSPFSRYDVLFHWIVYQTHKRLIEHYYELWKLLYRYRLDREIVRYIFDLSERSKNTNVKIKS